MNALHHRIRSRLEALDKSERKASLDSGLSGDAIGKMLKNSDQSQTLRTIEKLAIGLETTPEYLAFGISRRKASEIEEASHLLCVDRALFRECLLFVLSREGVPDRRAALIADILPEALSGPPVEAVDGDPLLSFRVHFQIGAQQYGHPTPR